MNFTTMRLNGYAVEMGFESESERLQMIVDAPASKTEAISAWLDTDGSKQGLIVILADKRPWQLHTHTLPCPACRLFVKGNERTADQYFHEQCSHFHVGACPEIEEEPYV
jgi:cytidine deaminase